MQYYLKVRYRPISEAEPNISSVYLGRKSKGYAFLPRVGLFTI